MDDEANPEDRNRRGSLAISALLNDVAVNPCRSPVSDDGRGRQEQQQDNRSDYFVGHPDMVMFSSLPASPGCPRREPDAIYMPEQRPTTSWDPATAITPDGFHHRKTSKGNIIVSSIAKAKRKRISQDQFRRLMDVFEQTDTPSSEVRENLAHELNMTKREVQVWFQNRRAKVSRQRASNQKYSASRSIANPQPTPGMLISPPPPPPPPQPRPLPQPSQRLHQHPLQQQPAVPFYPAVTPPAQVQVPLVLQSIAPMPSYQPQMAASDPLPGHKRRISFPGQQDVFEYFNYNDTGRSSSIQQSMAGLSIRQAPPVRKRAKSAIDVLASAAEYVGTEDLKTEQAPVR